MELDLEWKDGDDSALVDQGYNEALEYVHNTITKVLENPQIDIMPASMALRVLAASLKMDLTNEED